MPIRNYSTKFAASFALRFGFVLLVLVAPAGSVWAQMEHVVFITANAYSINSAAVNTPIGNSFGGLQAADVLCNNSGQSPFLLSKFGSLTYKAILSDATVHAKDRVAIIGRVVNAYGEVLATGFNDLWDGSISNGVKFNDQGGPVSAGLYIWTGSNPFGYTSQTASNWTSSSSSTLVDIGLSQVTHFWFSQGTQPANQSCRLFAISEPRVINPGDFNDDGKVDTADYVVWRHTMGNTVARGVAADGDGDGSIGNGDYNVWRAKFGTTYSAGSGSSIESASVPEPSTLLLLGIGAISLLGYRKAKTYR